MVLGLRTKYRKGPTVHVDYLIHVQEIKPWPPSQSLKSLRSVLLQWENGDRNSGSTSSVVPSLGSGVGDGKIEFDQSFRLPVTLTREFSLRSGDAETFQKNYLEFNLYEPRRDKAVKGQHLGVAMIDLAEYGILKETVIISAPMNCKRSFRNTVQPVLFLKIQPFDKHSSSSTPKGSLVKESSLDLDGRDSVSALMNGEYADEAEITAFTDDDISSHSSLTIYSSGFEITGDSPAKDQENALEAVKNSTQMVIDQSELPLESVPEKLEVNRKPEMQKHLSGSSSGSSSTDSASGVESPENDQDLLYSIPQSSLSSITGRMDSDNIQSSSSFIAYEATDKEVKCDKSISTSERKDLTQKACSEKITNGNRIIEENVEESVNRKGSDSYNTEAKVESSDEDPGLSDEPFSTNNLDSHLEAEDHKKIREQSSNGMESGSNGGIFAEDKGAEEQQEDGCKGKYEEEYYHSMEFEHVNKLSPDSRGKLLVDEGDTTLSRSGMWMKSSSLSTDRQRHGKSVRSSSDSPKLNGSASSNQHMGERKEIDILEGAHSGGRRFGHSRQNNLTAHSRESRANLSDGKFQQLEHRIEKLEGELREAAALELALYSIVAEHGSSANKVHAPARRLSRLHLHAWRHWSHARRASVAKSAISGLVLVVKACGNDVPRLSFWLSNSVILRVIISLALVDSKLSVFAAHHAEANGNVKENGKRSLLKWKESPSSKKENKFGFDDNSWEDPHTFTTALEKIEAWIFSRIIESVWWQTLIPHMQSASRKANEQKMCSSLRNSYGKKPILSDQEQANFSLELWKKAFKDACERICPVRAAGHECGCLPVLARMVMEQCVGRLDVAMFNAILRESADEIPTDPVSDPISDSKVLPIPAGKSSFGAGAQLKNAIGNWSRWLTDLFGIDDDECHEDENELDDNDRRGSGTSSKSFHLLNALSDLMMLPKDMLLNRAVKKEVCPSIGAPLIKRILSNFAPDEFCPDPIPEVVFEALDAEDTLDADEVSSIRNFPCDAAPVVYSPPSAVSLESIIGEVGNETPLTGSGSSLLRKSYTSDDELEELESPLTSILDGRQITTMPKQKTKVDGQRALRYQLLQEVWRD